MTQPYSVFDQNGMPQSLDPKLGAGGEGTIYPLTARSEVLVKLYHSKELAKRGPELQKKVEAMHGMRDMIDNQGVSWPLISVFDQARNWLGYAMYRASGKPMFNLAHAVLYKKHFPDLDRRQLVAYLINLVSHLNTLHQRGVMVGDYNLNNIICHSGSEQVTLIDCDSYQLTLNGRHFPSPVGTPDMTPIEHHGMEFSSIKRNPQSEAFSLAIVLFKCLMLGRHPYDIVDGDDPVTNLRRGDFAYGIGNKGIPKGPWYNIWSHMPHRLKSQFIATFTEGANDPAKRTSLDEWLDSLQLYRKEMDKGWHEVAIRPDSPKPSAYRGSQSRSQ